jgi:hypothetical protein
MESFKTQYNEASKDSENRNSETIQKSQLDEDEVAQRKNSNSGDQNDNNSEQSIPEKIKGPPRYKIEYPASEDDQEKELEEKDQEKYQKKDDTVAYYTEEYLIRETILSVLKVLELCSNNSDVYDNIKNMIISGDCVDLFRAEVQFKTLQRLDEDYNKTRVYDFLSKKTRALRLAMYTDFGINFDFDII